MDRFNVAVGKRIHVPVTAAAGCIGFHIAKRLLDRGDRVIGLDNMSPCYSVALKRCRLAELSRSPAFLFYELDLADRDALRSAIGGAKVKRLIHLASQAGVRYSLTHTEFPNS